MKTIVVRLRRPSQGWNWSAGFLDVAVDAVEEDIPLYVLLRRVREKVARADRGEIQTEILPFEFSLDGAVRLRDYLYASVHPFLDDLFNHLRDAIDDHEEAERDRAMFDELRRRATLPSSPVRERWEMEGAGSEDAEGEGHLTG